MPTWLENIVHKMCPRGGDKWQKMCPMGWDYAKKGRRSEHFSPPPPPVQGIQLTDAFT